MNKLIISLVIILVITSVLTPLLACGGGGETPTPKEKTEETETSSDMNIATPSPNPTSSTPETIPEDSAEFEVTSLIIDPTEITSGDMVTVTADVSNIGEIYGTYIANLVENGETVESKEIVIEAGDFETVTFNYVTTTCGTHTLDLEDRSASFEVLEPIVLDVSSVVVTPELVLPGQEAKVEADIKNIGEVEGTAKATLAINGIESDTQPITLLPGASERLTFTAIRDLPGTYDLSIDDMTAILTVADTEEYYNETYHYTISYPKRWAVSEPSTDTVYMANKSIGTITVIVEEVQGEMTRKEYYTRSFNSTEAFLKNFELITKSDVEKDGVVVGHKYSYDYSEQGAKHTGTSLVMKKGRYGFTAHWRIKKAAAKSNELLLEACLDSFTPPEVALNTYTNDTYGFTLELPQNWDGLITGKTSPLLIVKNIHSDYAIYTYAYIDWLSEETSIKEWASEKVESWDSDDETSFFEIESEGPITLGVDTEGYTIVFDYIVDSVPIRSSLTSVIQGSYVISLLALSHNILYIMREDQIDRFLRTFTLIEPTPFGVPRHNSLFFLESDVLTLDPAVAEESPSSIVGAIFSGLVRTGKSLDVIPDIAEKWEVSEDGTVYTFYLRSDAKFHDGKQVTAQDFKYSWERACNPDTESRTSGTYLGDIVGAKEMLAGEATELSGVRVIDDYTLEVTIDGPKPYFLGKLAYVTSHVVDRANVERGMKWTDAPNGTGPFKLKEWDKGELLILERNPDYYYASIEIENVVYQMSSGYSVMMYEQGEIDITGVSISDTDRVLDSTNPLNRDLVSETMIGMGYVAFNSTMPPFDDPKVREAFAVSLDMEKILEVSMKGRAERAAGYVPDGMPGHNPDLELLTFDPDLAKQLIAESEYSSVDNLPPITFYAAYGLRPSQEAMIGMWQQNLGITVDVETVEEAEDWQERMDNLEFQIFTAGWSPDYMDPQNYLEVLFHSESDFNHFAYSNPDVDAALEAAAIQQDEDIRIAMYQDIEKQILADLPAIPLYHNYTSMVLVKPYVIGYIIPRISLKFWEDLSINPTR